MAEPTNGRGALLAGGLAAMLASTCCLGPLILLMLVIGVVAPRATAWVQRDSGEVDLTPWRWAMPAGLVMILLVLGIYITFADTSILAGEPAAVAQP